MRTGDLVEVHYGYGDDTPWWAKGGGFFGGFLPYARLIQLGDPAVVEVLRTGNRESVPLNRLFPARLS